MTTVSARLRRTAAERASFRCEYCQSLELVTGGPFHIEHIVPVVLGGTTSADNLAYSCARCNLFKGRRARFRDPISGRMVPVFNPRTQVWARHFYWNPDGTRIIGRTQVARATIVLLQMNHPTIVQTRSIWVHCGLHPPK